MRKIRLLPILALSLSPLAAAQAADATVGFVRGRNADPVFVMMECGVRKAANEAGNTLVVDGPAAWDAQLQVPVVRAMITQQPDAMVLVPNDGLALQQPVKEALANGVKVVTADQPVAGNLVPHVSTDNVEGGRLAARETARLMNDQGTLLIVGVAVGITGTDLRHQGFMEEIAKHPNITVLDKQYAGDSSQKVSSIIRSTLAAHPDLAGIHADATLIGEFTGATLNSLGRTDIPATSFDASPAEVEWLQKGALDGLLPWNPLDVGYRAGRIVNDLLLGKAPPQGEELTPYVFVTRENLSDPAIKPFLYSYECEPKA